MIKGINKNVIEVIGVESEYYEKAILFIKPQYREARGEMLEIEAKRLLGSMDTISSIKRKRGRVEKVMIGMIAAVATATICIILLM